MAKTSNPLENKVLARIYGHGRGMVFTPAHFVDLGTRTAVASVLSRLTAAGTIRQLARGLYDYPIDHPQFGLIAPSTDAIARALAARNAIRLQPAGAYAANLLGLSDQVPSKVVFLTDGPSRHVRLGNREIVLKRTTPRNMATAGRKAGTVIQALRYIGRANVTDKEIAILRRQMTDEDRRLFPKDLRYAPAWIAEILRRLADEKG